MDLSVKALDEKYSNFLGDIQVDKLELLINHPNIFSILKVSGQEIRHSNFLAWLLDPHANHGLGNNIMKRILRDIFLNEKAKEVSIHDIEGLAFDKVEIKREWKNIDILIQFPDTVICIENKVYSGESKNQLEKYKKIIETEFPLGKYKRAFVFLTPFGIESIKETEYFVSYSYAGIISILEKVSKLYGESIHEGTRLYINDYIKTVKREIMNNDEAVELAKNIYKNHKELLDFIFDKKPDVVQEFRKYFEDKVRESGWILGSVNKGYVRFLTPALNEIIPKGKGEGWPKKEAFLFEINYYWTKGKAIFFCTISPGDEEARSILKPVLDNLPGSNPPAGNKWLTYFFRYINNFDCEKLYREGDDVKIKALIDGFWPEVEDVVKNVEEGILAHKDELLAINNKLEVMN